MCLFRCPVLRCLCRGPCGHGAARHLDLLSLVTQNVATCMWTAATSLLPRTILRNVVGVCTLCAQLLFKSNLAVPFSVVWYGRGVFKLSNNLAELVALVHVLEFVLSQPSSLNVMICFDSMYAAYVVQQSWQAKSHLEVVRFPGELQRRCDLHAEVRWHWIRGHSRDLGNEAADALAKAGARGWLQSLLHASAVGSAITERWWSMDCKSFLVSLQLLLRPCFGEFLK